MLCVMSRSYQAVRTGGIRKCDQQQWKNMQKSKDVAIVQAECDYI